MVQKIQEVIIISIIVSCVCLLYIFQLFLSSLEFIQNPQLEYKWLVDGLLNTVGYLNLLLPGYLIYKYVNKTNFLNKSGRGIFGGIIRTCFAEEDLLIAPHTSPSETPTRSTSQEALLWLYYFCGLQISFLTWGILQEKIMTQKYTNSEGEESHFGNSQFLVFVNKMLAFCISGLILVFRRQPRHRCPLYKYSFCSLSNIMSSWCQYEALRYVSFPHQVLAKTAKIIPVMIMGKIVSKTKYEFYEYVTAIILSIGMLLFMLDTGNDRTSSTVTTFSGVILLCLYILFDSFTSNWQGELFKQFNIKPVQMMCFINFYSCIFTAVSLVQQGNLMSCFHFMTKYPSFIFDCVILSICSSVGQLFIFSTIATFGPLVFVIITTIRQGFAVLLSCIIYHHAVHVMGVVGVLLVFISMLLRAYCNHRLKTIRANQSTSKIIEKL